MSIRLIRISVLAIAFECLVAGWAIGLLFFAWKAGDAGMMKVQGLVALFALTVASATVGNLFVGVARS